MTQSFNNQTVDQVSMTLARRQVGLRRGMLNPMDKIGFDLSGSLKGIGDWYKSQNPVAQKAMLGAGLGGALGLGSSVFRRDKKRPFRDALTGMLAGGALGGGYGLLTDRDSVLNTLAPKQDTAELSKTMEELQDLQGKAQPSLLHQLGGAAAERPITTGLGLVGAADVGTGMGLAAQGKNVSPAAWQNVSKTLADQLADKGTVDKTQIGQLLDRYGIDIKRWESAAKGPGKLEVLRRDNPLLQALLGGDKAEISEALKNLKDPVTGKPIDPREVMGRLKNVKGVYRPMTASQYAAQRYTASPQPKFQGKWWSPFNKAVKGMPKSLPNVPGKAKAIAAALSLLGLGYAGSNYMQTEGARSKLDELKKAIGQ